MSVRSMRRARRAAMIAVALMLTLSAYGAHTGAAPVRAQAAPVIGFSVAHGLFDAAFAVELTTTLPAATIRYTTDFETPTAVTGTVYAGPIAINRTTVLRAFAYSSATTATVPVATQTYIFPAQVVAQPNTPGGAWPPIFSKNDGKGPYPADYEMDPQVTGHPGYSNTLALPAVLRALPSISIVTDQRHLWDAASGIYYNQNEEGALWERPISVEWIDPAGASAGFSERAGMRVHGNSSRRPYRTPKKSFRLVFGSAYGNPRLDFKVFDDPKAAKRFERLVLRGGSNYSWLRNDRDQRRKSDFVVDEYARRAWLDMGGLAARGGYAHVYLNGLYWGVYNITERMDERFLAGNLGGARTDYDLIEPNDDNDPTVIEAASGELTAWNILTATLGALPVSDEAYAQAQALVDVENLADYMLLMHMAANTDWPAHNWYVYRKRTGSDRRFKMIVWDSDTSMQDLDEDVTRATFPGSPADVFLRLMTHPDFRQLVADRFYWHVQRGEGALTSARCIARYTALTALVDRPIVAESARWGDYARDVYNDASAPKGAPAYLYSRDLPDAYTDPQALVPDSEQLTWLENRAVRLNSWCPQRPALLLAQYAANSWDWRGARAPADDAGERRGQRHAAA
jgi:hypothetical protein